MNSTKLDFFRERNNMRHTTGVTCGTKSAYPMN